MLGKPGFRIGNILKSVYQFINLSTVNLKSSTNLKRVKYFVFLQFTGPNPWYFLLHSPNNFEGNIDCPRGTFSSPVGNISLVIGTAYVIP